MSDKYKRVLSEKKKTQENTQMQRHNFNDSFIRLEIYHFPPKLVVASTIS